MTRAGSDPDATREIARAQDQLFRAGGSARAKYSALVVGRPGLGALLKHELVTQLSQAVPGALGLALAGPRRYAEGTVEDPWIGDGTARAREADIARAAKSSSALAVPAYSSCDAPPPSSLAV